MLLLFLATSILPPHLAINSRAFGRFPFLKFYRMMGVDRDEPAKGL